MRCKICQSPTVDFASAEVMGKHRARYRRCTSCGFVFVESPTWLEEAYRSAINRTDLGTVSRTERNSLVAKAFLELSRHRRGHCLDYGAGYGMFVRRMRDLGYDFWAFDEHCENLFAHDFHVSSLVNERFELVTSFEVFEHLENPMQAFEAIFSHSDALLFTTELMPASRPRPGNWWYYGLDHGQHISFFTAEAIAWVAKHFSKHIRSECGQFHIICDKPPNALAFRCATNEVFGRWFNLLKRRPSLLPSDFYRIRQALLKRLKVESE